jgi:hypothetical protein
MDHYAASLKRRGGWYGMVWNPITVVSNERELFASITILAAVGHCCRKRVIACREK